MMMSKFEECWLCRHAPGHFSADPELCQTVLVRYLGGHGVTVNERPARSPHKNGRVERRNGTFNYIFEKLSKEHTKADVTLIVARASFMTNIIFGRSKLHSLQLARGYMTSVVGLPKQVLTQDVLQTRIQVTGCRAIRKAFKTPMPSSGLQSIFETGDKIHFFYKSTNKSIDVDG